MTAQLTPTTNQNPVVVSVQDELSGEQWCSRFPTSISTDELAPEFKASCDAFIAAIEAAGGHYSIGSTYRPPERAYLMHWCWKIKHGTNPSSVPHMNGVNIEWVHPNYQDSIEAAKKMVDNFGMHNLNVAPSLHSLHMERIAIDISISWSGNLHIAKRDGTIVNITTAPRDGMNLQLKEVGHSYGVIKFVGGASDRPHWSATGY
jgi:hypothetical protein